MVEALILGVVQGLTEFLPISSSAHLALLQSMLPGFSQPGLLFDIMLHCGTLAAVVLYLRKDIKWLLISLFSRRRNETSPPHQHGKKIVWYLVLALIPTALIGYFGRSWVMLAFTNPLAIALLLLITGWLLFGTRFFRQTGKGVEGMRRRDAILIGIAQGVATFPGISRSGATIATGIFAGMDRELAARFSFLASIPAIVGALILDLIRIFPFGSESEGLIFYYISGTIAAAIIGYFALAILFRIIKGFRLSFFAYYCWGLGLVVIGISFLNKGF
ncbi:MAG: undecaprenyl-diphosphate phosphatase [Acidobacteriota bacterium]